MAVTIDRAKFTLGGLGKNRQVDASKQLEPVRIGEVVDSPSNSSSVLRIPVNLLEIDENNIRTSPNPKFNEIRKSIESDNGRYLIFYVVKNADNEGYRVVRGSGTRLSVLKDLEIKHAEEQDNPFKITNCILIDELDPIDSTVSSIMENSARGENSYAEWSKAIIELKNDLEKSLVGALSDDRFCKLLKEKGISLNKTEVVRCRFASDQLTKSVPVAMNDGRKTSVFVRKIMEARSSAINRAKIEFNKSRDYYYPAYDETLIKVGNKLDDRELDVEILIRKTESTFFKTIGLSLKKNTIDSSGNMDVKNNIDTESNSTHSNITSISPLSEIDVIQYLASLHTSEYDRIMGMVFEKRSNL